jgi:hypothetical protein
MGAPRTHTRDTAHQGRQCATQSLALVQVPISATIYGRGAGVGRGLGLGEGLGVGVNVAVGVAVAVAVAVGVGVGVSVGVAVAVAVAVGDGVPHGSDSCTSSTYIPVTSAGGLAPSWCTRNLMRTVCPAYGPMSTVCCTQVSLSLHWWKIVCRMAPLLSVT